MRPSLLILILLGLTACKPGPRFIHPDAVPHIEAGSREQKFAPDIALMLARDSLQPPPTHGIVFAGSSSITRWDSLQRDFAPLPVINRGFGGSGIRQVSHYAPRIILPLQPREIYFYCGENDICNDATPATQVLHDFKDFVALIRSQLPDTRITYISMKPSPLRWQWWPKFQEGNRLVQDFIREERGLDYVDVSAAMLDSTGRPHRSIWTSDSLHMNLEGYALWVDILRKRL